MLERQWTPLILARKYAWRIVVYRVMIFKNSETNAYIIIQFGI